MHFQIGREKVCSILRRTRRLSPPKLTALGAIAVPLIIGRALKLSPEQTAILMNADLLACGLVTIIQSMGLTPWSASACP